MYPIDYKQSFAVYSITLFCISYSASFFIHERHWSITFKIISLPQCQWSNLEGYGLSTTIKTQQTQLIMTSWHGRPMGVFLCLNITLLNYHHYARPIAFQVYSVERVSKIKSILSVILHAIHGTACIRLTYFSYDDRENTCTLSWYHHQIGSMIHLPLFRIRSWNYGMRCMSFYILMETFSILMALC